MKANEAPEKIYLYPDDRAGKEYDDEWGDKPWGEGCVEYTRTDAFVKKACEFIKDHHHEFSFWNTEEYELGFSTQKFIEDFVEYLKK